MPFSKTVARVIELAAAIRDYWDAELPKRHPKYPLVEPGADDGPPPPEEAELHDLLRSLPVEEVYKLLALLDVGRQVCPAPAFDDQRRTIAEQRDDPDWAISSLVGNAALAEDLADGLNELERSGIGIDRPEPFAT